MHSHRRRTVLTIVKFALAAAILGWLVWTGQDAFAKLSEKPVEWSFLVAAMLCTLGTATLNFIRWHILIRAVGIDVRLIDSVRLGALGFALNYASPGSIGGDFFKAVFLAHGQPGRRTEAVATVIADRVMGLLTMLLLASIGILATGLLHASSPEIRVLSYMILVVSAIAWIGFILLMSVDALTGEWVSQQALRLRLTGKTIVRLLSTVRAYRGEMGMVIAAFAVSLVMALGFITSFYLVARGLPIHAPPWSQHLVIVPVAGLAGAVVPTPSGVGTTEAVVEELYRRMPGGELVEKGDGGLVGIGRRLTDIAVALLGYVFYMSHRREVRAVMAEAEEIAEEEGSEERGARSE